MDLCVEIVFGPESGNNSGLNIALETGGAVVEWVVNIHIKVKRKTLNTEVVLFKIFEMYIPKFIQCTLHFRPKVNFFLFSSSGLCSRKGALARCSICYSKHVISQSCLG
jgi:hypothetical protein